MGRLGEVCPSIEAGLQASSPSAVNTAKGEVPTVGLVAWIPLERAGQEWAREWEVTRRACAEILRRGREAAEDAWGRAQTTREEGPGQPKVHIRLECSGIPTSAEGWGCFSTDGSLVHSREYNAQSLWALPGKITFMPLFYIPFQGLPGGRREWNGLLPSG